MAENSNFDLRKVSNVALTGIDLYDELNLPADNRDQKFCQLVADVLTHNPIVLTAQSGAYLRLFTTEIDGEKAPVAIKILRDDSNGYDIARRQLETIDRNMLQEFMHTDTHLFMQGRIIKTLSLSDLSEKERIFVLLAWEHSLHEKLYSPYVMPAIFVSFKAKNDVFDKQILEGESHEEIAVLEYIKSELREKGRLSDDNREIYVKQGETVYAMVQNFELFSSSVFSMPYKDFTEPQLKQLTEFADLVENVWKTTGYFPDSRMSHPRSGNLKFLGNRLVLVDTNSIRRQDNNSNDYPGFIGQIRHIIERARK